MIQASLATKQLDNSASLPEMRQLIRDYCTFNEDLRFLNAIHVTGSKGKGSVCAFTESILRRAGLRTGMFTSPHLVHPRERIRIDGQPVAEALFARHVLDLNKRISARGEFVSYFRFIWMVALEIFAEEKIDAGIIEVGIGGRYDATNVIPAPICCGITSLALEHVNILGSSLKNIAWHKAGIMKPNIQAFSVAQQAEAEDVLLDEAKIIGNPLCLLNDSVSPDWKLGIDGEHQRMNAALAVSLSKYFAKEARNLNLDDETIKRSLLETTWAGRQQFLPSIVEDVHLFLDGSHTYESIQYTATWFESRLNPEKKKVLLFHCSGDRDGHRLLEPLLALSFDYVFFVIPDSLAPGKDSLVSILVHHQKLADHWNSRTMIDTPEKVKVFGLFSDCWNEILQISRDMGPLDVLVCGSLYLVGTVMKSLNIST